METFPENLTDAEAKKRFIQFGPNEIPQVKKENFLVRNSKLLKEPMILLLIAASIIYLFMGDLGEGLLLSSFVFVIIGISIYQERKSEKALAALRELASPRSLVIRNGVEKRISSVELVPDDLIVLREGDRVPADGMILQSSHFSVDESLLTGESFPVQNPTKFFSSTLVISGTAYARVVLTGVRTEVGKIGKSLQASVPEELNLSKEIQKIIIIFAWGGATICIALVLLYGLTRGDWLQAFLVGLATQMSLLPEEFPVVLTIFLAMGAWRLSKIQVLIRNPASIERLGAVSVLCVDKTGTLTQNQMTVVQLNNTQFSLNINSLTEKSLDHGFHEVVEFGVLASQLDPFDPMEKAIRRLVEGNDWGKEHLHRDWEYIRGYPLSHQLLAMSCVWKDPKSEAHIIAAKGAPEAILDLCHIDPQQTQNILATVKEMAQQGLRILGVARASFSNSSFPEAQHDFEFHWIGLIGLEDPLRPEVPDAVQLCRQAGIRVIMMTGDYPETALKIAEQAGINTLNALITGKELDHLSEQELEERLKTAHIFARMIPEQKLRIVKALKNSGQVVAMTGDGVNDAPSLKWANIGIAMGLRGTDVAREAADIVLLDDNFASIVSGIKRGRLIFSNIKNAMSYIATIHVSIAGLAIIPVICQWPLILMPIHIVFLQLIIDPACSLMFESQIAEDGLMSRPPRSLNSRLFSAKDLLRSFLQGMLILGVCVYIFWYSTKTTNMDADRARALTFIILTLSNIGLIFADMSGGSFAQLQKTFKKISNILIVLVITVSLILITNISQTRILFHFGPLSPLEFITAEGIGIIIFVLLSTWNWINSRSKLQSQMPQIK